MTPNIFSKIFVRTKLCISLHAPIKQCRLTLSDVRKLSSELRVLRMELFSSHNSGVKSFDLVQIPGKFVDL